MDESQSPLFIISHANEFVGGCANNRRPVLSRRISPYIRFSSEGPRYRSTIASETHPGMSYLGIEHQRHLHRWVPPRNISSEKIWKLPTYVVFQKLCLNAFEPTFRLLRQNDSVPSDIIFRATVFARLLIRSSSVARYVEKVAKVSSKKTSHSGPKFGAPLKRVKEDASRNNKILCINSAELAFSRGFNRVYCSSA